MQGSTDPTQPPSWSFFISGTFIDHNQGTSNAAAPPAAASALLPQSAAQAQQAAQQHQQQPRGTADRNWTAAMSSIQMRVEEPGSSEPPRVVRWERNRHAGQHKEQIEYHQCALRLCLRARLWRCFVDNATCLCHTGT
jgi:hypothetical protein